ncbi:MAG: hypothetical protein HY698_01090 [Deltaproteobacteria bacterium]|nr:hypothetical protein [Deltaproteobacteria bacterium]
MPLPRTPLDLQALSDAARKALSGPPPLKLMAARGLAPLPKPADVVSVLYQLSLETDAPLRTTAEKTARELPDRILGTALADPQLDPRVLDFFAELVVSRPSVLEALILNHAAADETIVTLAQQLGERELDLIAQNEQRILRAPGIIGALYMNKNTRMSTVDRVVELAVRHKIAVPGIPAWDEVVAAVLGTAKPTVGQQAAAPASKDAEEIDALFAAAVQVGSGEPEDRVADSSFAEEEKQETAEQAKKKVPIDRLSIPAKIRLATVGNAFARSILIRDSNKQVALATIRSPAMTDNEVIKFSAFRSLSDEVIRVIANSKDWTKNYQVKLNLVNNPKTPLSTAFKFLPFLQVRDLRSVARSKGIPQALANQAKKLVTAKMSGGD